MKLKSAQVEEITSEETLVDVYRNVTGKIRKRRMYKFVPCALFILLVLAGIWSGASATDLGNKVREWCNNIFTFAGTVLGILLAGFAFFTTISAASFIKYLALIKEPKSGLSYLKYSAGAFMSVFIPYVAFIAMYVPIYLFGWLGGPVTKLVNVLSDASHVDVGRYCAAVMMGIVGAFFSYLILELQAFVFNVYSIYMLIVRTRLELEEDIEEEAKPSESAKDQAGDVADKNKRIAESPQSSVHNDERDVEDDGPAEEEEEEKEVRRH